MCNVADIRKSVAFNLRESCVRGEAKHERKERKRLGQESNVGNRQISLQVGDQRRRDVRWDTVVSEELLACERIFDTESNLSPAKKHGKAFE